MDDDATPRLRASLGTSAKRFTSISTFREPARSRVQEVFDRAKASLEEDFTGITAGGVPADGLFPIVRTGVSAAPIVEAANAFRASLTSEQWRDVNFDIDDRAWRSWHNMHIFLMRHGLLLDDLDPAQRGVGPDRGELECRRLRIRAQHHEAERARGRAYRQ